MAEKITVAEMEMAVITTARKRKKEIRINLEINNPDHAHKVNHAHKVPPDHKESNQGNRGTNPDNKAIRSDATSKKIVNEEMDNVLIEVPGPTIHPDHKERNQPEMKNLLKNKTSLLKSLILQASTQPAMNRLYIILFNPCQRKAGSGMTHYSSMFRLQTPLHSTMYP